MIKAVTRIYESDWLSADWILVESKHDRVRVIVLRIKKKSGSIRSRLILLISRMIEDRIGLHSVLLL